VCADISELCLYICIVSSPYLLVFGNDGVIRYMRVDDVVSDVGEAKSRSGMLRDLILLLLTLITLNSNLDFPILEI